MRTRYKLTLIAAMLTVLTLPASAAELAILRNGFSIRHERREAREDVTRLYIFGAPDNYIDVPTADIARYEECEDVRPTAPPAASKQQPRNLDEVIDDVGRRNSISPTLISSVIRAESGFNPNALSPKGARGLMQLMPQTAARLGVQNTLDPADNIEGGTRYLRELLARYHNDLRKALAAYNAGPERVEKYNGIPPYPETIAYVTRIIRDLNQRTAPAQTAPTARANSAAACRNSAGRATPRLKKVRAAAVSPKPSGGAGG
jgi:soluble lytic murein transglycosylase-like protein